MPRPTISQLTAALGALLLQGCFSWSTSALPPRQVIEAHPDPIQLTLANGRKIQLSRPSIVRDSVFGVTELHEAVGLPLSQVRSVALSRFDGGRTVALVAATGATIILVAGAARGKPQPPPPPPPPPSGGGGLGIGSCPMVYSWDGREWRLDSGTFGGAITRGLQRTDVDNLDWARARHGRLRLRLTNELPETDHVDALAVIAVDHPAAWAPAPDAMGRLHSVGDGVEPLRATDFAGRDVLERVRTADGWSWESVLEQRDTASAGEVRDGIELTFVRPAGASRAHLVLDANATPWAAHLLTQFAAAHGSDIGAWYDSLDASPAYARATGMRLAREGFLSAAVWAAGRWVPQGLVWEAGPEVVKRQVLELDLRAVAGDTVRVRLESAPSFWLVDRAALDFTADQPMLEQPLVLRSAVDRRGRDVRELIAAEDDRYYTLATGDAATIEFEAPEVPRGLVRSYLLRSTGWYRLTTGDVVATDVALLAGVRSDPLGLSRAATARRNEALRQLEGGAR